MPETRRIENYGILKLLPVERGATELIITADVIQIPYSEYVNLKTNPFKSHYGYVCLMHKEYVLEVIDIQFRRQIIAYRNRHLVQLAWQEYCNSKTIAQQLGAPLPDTNVDYAIWLCDELRFRLEPGVILNVFKSHISPITCGSGGIVEPELAANPPGIPESPVAPPPPSSPEEDKIPLSSPYEGDDDNGNTYVRDIPQPPPTNENRGYKLSVSYSQQSPSGNPTPINYDTYVCGPVSYETEPMSGYPGREQLFITARGMSPTPIPDCGSTAPITRYASDNFIIVGTLSVAIAPL